MKRMIDADILIEWLCDNREIHYDYDNATEIIANKINELATHAPQDFSIGDMVESPNGSLFEAIKVNDDYTLEIKPLTPPKDGMLGEISKIASFTFTVSRNELKKHNHNIIFDAEGWCWDMNKAPTDGTEFFGYDKGIDDWVIVNYENGDFVSNNEAYNLVAWRPLPKLPTGGNRD